MARPEVKAYFAKGGKIKSIPSGVSALDKSGDRLTTHQSQAMQERIVQYDRNCELMLEYVKANPGVSISELSKILGFSRSKVGSFIKRYDRRIERERVIENGTTQYKLYVRG